MSTYKCIREVYESAADAADTIRNEMKHYPDNDIQELIDQEADRLCIYTQDNWDVCNIMRCSDEMETAESMAVDFTPNNIDEYMGVLAYYIWHELITEVL
jgi:hypothetical protein